MIKNKRRTCCSNFINVLALFALLGALALPCPGSAATILSESFETVGPNYDSGNAGQATVAVVPTAFNGANGVFDRTDGSDIVINPPSDPLTNYDGTYFWAAEFFYDAPGGLAQHSLTFGNIDISDHQDLSFSGLFAAAGQNNIRFDPADVFDVVYSVDGGPVQNGLCFNTVGGDAAGNNEPLAHDTNCDGNGDGVLLSEQFQSFGFSLPNGNSLDLTVTVLLDGADEEVFFDNLQVTGTLVPEPSGFAFILVALACFPGRRIRRVGAR